MVSIRQTPQPTSLCPIAQRTELNALQQEARMDLMSQCVQSPAVAHLLMLGFQLKKEVSPAGLLCRLAI